MESHHSVVRASAALGLSQPALTRALQDSEAVWASARRISAEFGRLEDELDRLGSANAGTVALPVAAVGRLPGVLAALRISHPFLQVRLVQGRTVELLLLLAVVQFDLFVGRLYEPPASDGFRRETLYDEPISVLARADHPIFEGDASDIDALARFQRVLPTMT